MKYGLMASPVIVLTSKKKAPVTARVRGIAVMTLQNNHAEIRLRRTQTSEKRASGIPNTAQKTANTVPYRNPISASVTPRSAWMS
ncbi:hypothetical protein OAL10_06060 [Gammaproteobacteria bacterium]|nr:hypothetical protein [Gammaproteobacteria bacterium]